jgi:hypothetical protein
MAPRRKRKSSRSTATTEIERDLDRYMRRRVRKGPRGKGGKLARGRVKKPVGLKRVRKKK